jgi:DNA (cytosine-5)-methyltransferase 1
MRFVDLFAGIGGFHVALSRLGHECVFASELDDELRQLYVENFDFPETKIGGDIRGCAKDVPPHDILCAGFPCQPFSKSGSQAGMTDATRGSLFHEIVKVVRTHRPPYVLLENVGNFERHDEGRTWTIVKTSLTNLGYHVVGTEHVTSGGHGLVSPHHLGFPQTRERFFIVATREPLNGDPFPPRQRDRAPDLRAIEQSNGDLSEEERKETRLRPLHEECIEHWNELLRRVPQTSTLPSFPIWGDEFNATYPFDRLTPSRLSAEELRHVLGLECAEFLSKRELLELLPSYAISSGPFPKWKVDFIRQNREWFASIARHVPKTWLTKLYEFPPSFRKLEWNCQGEPRNLWKYVLQFRPSGLRVKRYTTSPALVAMTVSQVPILGPRRRFISRTEGLRLQGFSDRHALPRVHANAVQALGNAVHAGVVGAIAERMMALGDIQVRSLGAQMLQAA